MEGAESTPKTFAEKVLLALGEGKLSKSEIATKLALRSVTGALNRAISELLGRGNIAFTLPDKPQSRLQKYRLVRDARFEREGE